jgi:hypothetical protein
MTGSHEVRGSIPLGSTKNRTLQVSAGGLFEIDGKSLLRLGNF